jgi:L-iditol 2-dehydrogenase
MNVHSAVTPSHRVVACRGGGETRLEERPSPTPGPGEMLIRLNVAGLCGTDLFKLGTDGAPEGAVLGHEVVGTVIAVHAEVKKFREGDRIVVPHHVPCERCLYCRRGNETMCATFRENLMEPGGFADRILIRRRAVAHAANKVPDSLTDECAVFLEPAACVLRGVDRSGLDADGCAVILGAGSMGLLHLIVLKAVHPRLGIVVIDPEEPRRAIADLLGATSTAAPGEEALEAVKAATAGHGADGVFDTVGGHDALSVGLVLTRPGGTVVLFAHAPHDARATLDLNTLFKSERRIVATYSGSLGEQRRIFDLLCSGELDPAPLVTHRLPLDDFQQGVDLVKQRKALKVLFTPSRGVPA